MHVCEWEWLCMSAQAHNCFACVITGHIRSWTHQNAEALSRVHLYQMPTEDSGDTGLPMCMCKDSHPHRICTNTNTSKENKNAHTQTRHIQAHTWTQTQSQHESTQIVVWVKAGYAILHASWNICTCSYAEQYAENCMHVHERTPTQKCTHTQQCASKCGSIHTRADAHPTLVGGDIHARTQIYVCHQHSRPCN
jgi:hypothetical protein